MFRKPLIWVVVVAASLGGVFFASRYFSSAYPIVSLDLRMNREEALARARDISGRLQFPPEGYREVASFSGDQFTQNFIELEGGGTAVLRSVIASGLHHPFTWTVRHFKPGETRETRISFTPQGLPWGFTVKLPENEKGAALDADPARKIAEDAAVSGWQVDLGPYQLVEKSRDVRPGGRVDHTFTYERSDARIGEGRYRLALVVSGDRLTELRRFIKVPEAFSRRYEQMRSANDLISIIDSASLVVLYFVGGCGVGLFFLLRKRWVLWRKPLFWGVLIAFLQLLAGVNDWPLSWMGYDTAVSAESFTAQRIAQLVLLFAVYVVVFTLSFMAAESLSRRAFPHHLQQWKLWSGGIANSKAVLGRTVGGYLLVGVFFAYDVFLYLAASKTLGWWTPSDALIQPDILSAYFPWLSPIAVSAQAGFWEESLFRAVPLAGAALLGDRFGKRKWWIAGAMIVQALIFGGGHAAYLNQPAYARVVELIIPSLGFGLIYLWFGLLPGILLHFTFDVVWFALPLFVSTAPGIWWDRILVILATLIPLWIVFGSRLRAKGWSEAPEACLNRAWVPLEAQKPAGIETPAAPQYKSAGALRHALPVAGLLGLLAWVFAGHFRTDAPPLTVSRGQAEALAQRTLEEHGVNLPAPWQELALLESQPGPGHRFVWQTAGKEAYQGLMGQYLAPPHWRIRFVRFEGDVAARAEEYQVFIDSARGAYRFRHALAEDTPGKSLAENDARLLAHGALQRQFQVDPSLLKEVSADSSKLKARTDWVFTFSDDRGVKIAPGEKRIAVQIAGDQVADAYRFVFTPEQWNRQDRDRQVLPSIINLSSIAVFALIALAGAVAAIVGWSRKQFVVSTFLLLLAALFAIRVVDFVNSLPTFEAQFSTAQPFAVQLFIIVLAGIVGTLVLAGVAGLIGGYVHPTLGDRRRAVGDFTPGGELSAVEPAPGSAVSGLRAAPDVLAGASIGCLAAGLAALGAAFGPSSAPSWADYAPLAARIPVLLAAFGPLGRYLVQSVVLLLILVWLDRYTVRWTKRKPLFAALLVLLGFAVAGMGTVETVGGWLTSGLVTGGLLLICCWIMLRISLHAAIYALAAFEVCGVLKAGFAAAWPWSLTAAIAAAVLVAAASLCLARILRGSRPPET